MLQPKKPKYRKQFKGRMHGVSKGGNFLNFGAFGLKAISPARITSRQIESARRCISRHPQTLETIQHLIKHKHISNEF